MTNILRRLQFTALVAATALTLGGCTTTTTRSSNSSFSFDPPMKQPQNPSAVKVKMSTGAGRIYVVEGDQVLLASPAAYGTASSPTPAGNHVVQAKVKNRRRVSQPGAGYPMTYWMQFYSPAYGMHWGFVKPYPCTHGCVRLPLNTARKIFSMVRVGTPINVASSQPWDATIGKTLPRLDDSSLPNPPMSYLLSPAVFADADKGKMWNF